MNIAQIIDAINGIDPNKSNWENELFDLCQQARTLGVTELTAAVLFQLLERYPDTYFGNPGPIVHALESFADFQTGLVASVKRQPVPSTMGMLNRVLNLKMPEALRKQWLDLLEESTHHPTASKTAKDNAKGFLEYQLCH